MLIRHNETMELPFNCIRLCIILPFRKEMHSGRQGETCMPGPHQSGEALGKSAVRPLSTGFLCMYELPPPHLAVLQARVFIV